MQPNFFEAVRTLERRTLENLPSEQRNRGVIGLDVLPEEEKIRFKANYELSYSATSVSNVGRLDNDTFETLLVNFLHLMGAEGTLPQHYTKLVINRIKQRDYALADFIDMFHHRLVSLFYRAWTKYRLVPQLEAYHLVSQSDPITDLINALAAAKNNPLSSQQYYSGHFSKRIRSANALEALLNDYLRQPVTVEQHVGSWLPLDEENLSQLQCRGNDRIRLGQGIMIGRRAWSVQSKIAIHINDLSFSQYKAITPGTTQYEALAQLIRNYTPHHISIDLFFYVHTQQARIGFKNLPQLSKNAWLYTQPKQILKAKATIQ